MAGCQASGWSGRGAIGEWHGLGPRVSRLPADAQHEGCALLLSLVVAARPRRELGRDSGQYDGSACYVIASADGNWQDMMGAAWWGVVIGAASAAVAVFAVWLTIHYRHRDRNAAVRNAIETLVRSAEGRRVLWKQLDMEQPERCFQSVSLLRDALITARTAVPDNRRGIPEIEDMARAAEVFLNHYEKLAGRQEGRLWRRKREVSNAELLELITKFRSSFLPALERLRGNYSISPGRPPASGTPSELPRQLSSVGDCKRNGEWADQLRLSDVIRHSREGRPPSA